jgi:hypothetical protein
MGLRCHENTRDTLIFGRGAITFCYEIAAASPLPARTTPDTHEVAHLHATAGWHFIVWIARSVNLPAIYGLRRLRRAGMLFEGVAEGECQGATSHASTANWKQ